MLYATLTQFRSYRGIQPNDVADDSRILDLLTWTSKFLDTNYRRFDIRRETRKYNYPGNERSMFGHYSIAEFVSEVNAVSELASGLLRMDDDLQEVITLTNGNGDVIPSTAFITESANLSPKYGIRLLPSAGHVWQPSAQGNYRQCISVDSLWGYHDDYANAFVDSMDVVLDNPLTSMSNDIHVNDVDGIAGDLRSDRFQSGNMIVIDNEFCLVISRNTTTNILTCRRGYNGTLAVQHAQGTPIKVFRPMGNIELATCRLTAWRYAQKDANVFDKTTILATGVQITPSSIPPDVIDLLPNPRINLRA